MGIDYVGERPTEQSDDKADFDAAAHTGIDRIGDHDDSVENKTEPEPVHVTAEVDVEIDDRNVSDLTAAGVEAYARASTPAPLALERRGNETFLVLDASNPPRQTAR